jgi:ADP-ribose pyrophosphatase
LERGFEVSGGIGDHEILSSEKVFDGKVVKVFLEDVLLPDGRKVRWERVEHPGAVGIVPLLREDVLLMVRQYRHAVRGELLEIPAGKLDHGESPGECAERELTEEVAHKAGRLIKLAEFYNSPGYSDERFFLYLGMDLSPKEGESEPDEFLVVVEVDINEALSMISRGEIRDAKSIIGITLAGLFLNGQTGPYRD